MDHKKQNLEREFILSPEEIDRMIGDLAALLSDEAVDRKDALRLRLILEETLLFYRDHCTENAIASLRFSRSFGTFRVSLKVRGESFDPFSSGDSSVASVMGSLLASSDTLSRTWKHRNGANMVTFTLMRKRKLNQMSAILFGVACGASIAFLINALQPQASASIATRIVTPLTNAFTGLLCVMATLMCFGSITLGIVRLGDISTFSAVGKKTIRSFLLVALLLTLFNTACMVPGLSFGNSSSMSIDFYDFFEILISFVPNNILSPILEFNSVHIIIIGMMFGIAMLHMAQKAERLTEIFDEVNLVAILSNSYLNRFIPIYVGLMVCNQILTGQFSVISGFLRLFLIVIGLMFATLALYTLLVCIRLKVNVRRYISKLLPSFAISLSSANVGAAFSTTIDTLIGPLGVEESFAPLAYNLGGILFRPGYCIVFTACSVFAAVMYGIEISWSWLLATFLLSFILSVATPQVIGGTAVCFSILFSQLGIKQEALTVIISVNAVFEFLTVAVNNYCLQSQIVLLGDSLNKLDRNKLRE